jgi:hypothetical protein
MTSQRSGADWAALVKNEIDGKEPAGTVARLLAEITGHDPHHTEDLAAAVLALTEAARDPKRILADLDKSLKAHRAEREAALAEQVKAARAKADMEAELVRHKARLDQERVAHERHMLDGQNEVAELRKQAAALLAKAEADAGKAATMKAELDRKLKYLAA